MTSENNTKGNSHQSEMRGTIFVVLFITILFVTIAAFAIWIWDQVYADMLLSTRIEITLSQAIIQVKYAMSNFFPAACLCK